MLKTILTQLWKKNFVLQAMIIICLPLMIVVTTIGAQPILFLMLFIVLFSAFDSMGYSLTQDRDDEWSELRISYRIIQDAFEIVLLFWIYSAAGWKPVIASLIAHWLTTCDKLFYILRREPDYPGEYTWLEGWSIFLLTKYIGIKPTTTKTFNIAAFTGFVLGVIICLL